MGKLRRGDDQARATSSWVRLLAAREAEAAGELDRSLHPTHDNARAMGAWPHLARELFADLYGMAQEPEQQGPLADTVAPLLEQAAELPAWQQLRREAAGRPWACGLATARALRALEGTIEPDPERPEAEQRQVEQALAEGDDQALAEATEPAGDLTQDQQARVRGALREAAAEAGEEIDEIKSGLRGLGCGDEPGAWSQCQDAAEDVVQAMRQNPQLRRIAAIAGRLKLLARARQRQRSRSGAEEIFDVTAGADLHRLLPVELGMLCDETQELLLYRKLLEGAALCYELRGNEREERGPIVLCVDGSGSMAGRRHEWAMAVALSLCELAARQRRAFAIIHFAETAKFTEVVTDPANVTLAQILRMVAHYGGGGTNLGAALVQAAQVIDDHGALRQADVIFISDGDGVMPPHVVDKTIRAREASLYAVAIERAWLTAQQALCDGYAHIADVGSDGAAVRLAFGI